jgi:F-type H+-transporting ATPase subunit epsilon
MAGNFKLEVVTPDKIVVDEEVQSVVAPGVLGEFGVLIGHTPFLSSLAVGTLHYKDAGDQERLVFINSGFAEVLPNKVTILAESAERRRDIDSERAKAALQRAQQRLAEQKTDLDLPRAEAAIARAIQRLKIVETRKL